MRKIKKSGAAFTVAVVAASAAQPTTYVTVATLPCSATLMSANGVTYYSCGSTYYTQSYSGGSLVYVQTAPPLG